MGNKKYIYLILFFIVIAFFLLNRFNISGNVIGSVNITITNLASLNFTLNSVDFGLGSVNFGSANATIDTLGNVINGNWTPTYGGFVIENKGNTNLSVYIKSANTASSFLGGTNPGYYYLIKNQEANSCTVESVLFNSWINVNNIGYGDLVCSNMQFIDTKDSISLDIRLVIPSDALIGARTDTFTATGIS